MEKNLDVRTRSRTDVAIRDGRCLLAHTDLHAIVPVLSALQPAVDLDHDLVVFEAHLSELYQIALARRRTHLLAHVFPLLLVVSARGFVCQRLFRPWEELLNRGVLKTQAAHQLDALIVRELVSAVQRNWQARERQRQHRACEGTHLISPRAHRAADSVAAAPAS